MVAVFCMNPVATALPVIYDYKMKRTDCSTHRLNIYTVSAQSVLHHAEPWHFHRPVYFRQG